MTINGPAATMFGFYLANADRRGVPFSKLRGTLQNDILKEYIAQKCWCFPPRPEPAHHRRPDRVRDQARAAVEHDLDLGLPHPRGRARPRRRSWRSRSPTASPTSRSA
jgi:hypothetical protein